MILAIGAATRYSVVVQNTTYGGGPDGSGTDHIQSLDPVSRGSFSWSRRRSRTPQGEAQTPGLGPRPGRGRALRRYVLAWPRTAAAESSGPVARLHCQGDLGFLCCGRFFFFLLRWLKSVRLNSGIVGFSATFCFGRCPNTTSGSAAIPGKLPLLRHGGSSTPPRSVRFGDGQAAASRLS